MRVVSTKLKMVDAFTEVEFFGTINKWLKNAGPCKAVAEQLEACEEKVGVHLEAEYCIADTFRIEKEKATFTLFKLEQLFHQQTWTTEIILISSGGANEVFFHIDCSRDATRFDEAPEMRTEVIRVFVNSGYVIISATAVANSSSIVCIFILAGLETMLKLVFCFVRWIDSSQEGMVSVKLLMAASGSKVGISFTED